MKKGGKGGGSTVTGLLFEEKVDLASRFLALPGYDVSDSEAVGLWVRYDGRPVARMFKKREFLKFLEEEGINWKQIVSRELRPDKALLVRDTLFIIEVKYQTGGGSTDEKLQTCDFKRKQYIKLTRDLNVHVEYVYVLSGDFFDDPKYKDVFDYIKSVNCHYMFDEIPLEWFGLPAPKTE